MILSVSRRTDIPAFYMDWFLRRLREGWLLVPNPRAPHRLSRVCLTPDVVDGMVFWTKNPSPMLDRLHELESFGSPFYVQVTLNAYGVEMEPYLPPLEKRLAAFRRLSEALGPERVVWRYDPVLFNPAYSVDWHLHTFAELARELRGSTHRCIFSFLDFYRKIEGKIDARPARPEEMERLAAGFHEAAEPIGIQLFTCAESIDLRALGVEPAACIDRALLERLSGSRLRVKKDPNQRAACGCAESFEVGCYDSCPYGCAYCYATAGRETVLRNVDRHSAVSPLLMGTPGPLDRITERKMESCRVLQTSLFENA